MSKHEESQSSLSIFNKKIRQFRRLPFKIREPEKSNEPSTLCDWCSKLGFEVDAFVVKDAQENTNLAVTQDTRERSTSNISTTSTRSINQYEQQKKNKDNAPRYLGRLSQIRQKRSCPFCRLVLEIVDRPLDQRVPSSFYDEDASVWAKWVIDGQQEASEGTTGVRFVPRTRRVVVYSEPQAFKDGYIALLNESAPFSEFFGRRLKHHDLLDAEVLKSWIRTCESEHGSICEDSLVPKELMQQRRNVLRAIDVNHMCVVDVPEGARFVALSYLWGKNFEQLFTTSENLKRLSQHGALKKERLPQTIKDTIELTKMIGEKYLWTDSLALVHDKGFQYHDDWIYARAHITVVAGSGKDANAGLPGVRKDSRMWHQSIEEVVPGTKLMVTHLAEDYIATSQWDSRAWTFQERMLSRRCLLFVNGRVYFQCRKATFCEDMELPSPNGWSLDSIDMPTRIFREKPFVQYTSAVELYTRRELTNPIDILAAFEGVEQVLEKRLNTTIYYGLFESMMDSSLIWQSSKRLHTRPGFPTWSWAGWVGEIQWKYTHAARSWIQWHHTEEGNLEPHHFPAQLVSRIEPPIPWQQHSRRTAKKVVNSSDVPPLLHFHTVVATFALHEPKLVSREIVSPLRKRMTGPSALSTVRPAPADPGLLRTAIIDKNGSWVGSIDLDQKWQEMTGVPVKFLVMSRMSAFAADELESWRYSPIFSDNTEDEVKRMDYGVYNVLLVTENKGIYYREGLGRVLANSLSKAFEPEPYWQDVLLG